MTGTVKFDPGMGDLVVNFNDYINDVYSHILNLYSPHQKRAQFKIYLNKIQDYMKNNMGFYFGCLMWAYILVKENIDNPKEIEGNEFLNLKKEELENYDYSLQINFLDNYFDSFERDSAYYGGKKIIISQKWRDIVELYTEFLEMNKGFTETKTTADIKLPEKIKNLNLNIEKIKDILNTAINKKDLSIILDAEISLQT